MVFVVSVNAANPPPKKFKKRTDIKTSSSSSSSSSLPLPNDIIVKCFSYVRRCDYPSLSLVSKTFHRIIVSSELKVVRSLFNRTENVLYVALSFHCEENPIWYSLNPSHKLVSFASFPSLPCWGSSVIVIGQKVYVIGGCIDGELTTNVFVIDCVHSKCRFLPRMRVPRGCAAFGVVDEKIYIIGGCDREISLDNWIEVFDIKKETWESFSGLFNEELYKITLKSVVMNGKIYIMNRKTSFVYDPKEDIWEKDFILHREWKVGSCVIDNMLYTFGYDLPKRVYRIIVYDPTLRVWSFVKGVEDLPKICDIHRSRMANQGGKLTILLYLDENGERNFWCINFVLERRGQEGEIWGKVLWYNHVLKLKSSPTIRQCLDVPI